MLKIKRTSSISKWFYSITGGIIVFMALTNSIQSKFIFRPQELPADHQFSFNYDFEEMNFELLNGDFVNALFFPSSKDSKGVILYLHGNSKHIQHWGENASHFIKRGYDFFIIDYRGFGKSKGKITEWNMYEDALTAYAYLSSIYPKEKITIYGRSIGTGVASWLASKEEARMLVLETPFHSIDDILKVKLSVFSKPINIKYNFPTYTYLEDVEYPVHVIHGTKDKVTPYESAIKLTPMLKAGIDSFTTIENGGHKNLSDFNQFHSTLDQIL